MSKNTLRIFEFQVAGEREWLAAETVIRAIKEYCRITSMDITNFADYDEIVEIPEDKWDEYKVKDEDDNTIQTFRQWIDRAANHPDFIASYSTVRL